MPDPEQRVLVLAPTGRDAALGGQLLGALDVPDQSSPARTSYAGDAAGAGAVILADEALPAGTTGGCWRSWRAAHLVGPAADRPHPGGGSSELVLESWPDGNVTILERPMRLGRWSAPSRRPCAPAGASTRCATCSSAGDADRRKDEFLAMLGHELRNPLAAIRNALWVLDQAGSQAEPEDRQREIIDRQTRHLVRMVDDLLDVSRVTLGKINLQRRPVDLRDVVERGLAELGMTALAGGNDLDLTVEPGRRW